MSESSAIEPHLLKLYQVDEILYSERSPFQKVEVASSRMLHRILFLDGNLQLTTADECFYHEMIVHVPMASLLNPKRALIIGGGDGGTLRELKKYRSLEEIIMVEIDRTVVDVCNRLMPSINDSGAVYNDARVTLLFEDGIRFVETWDTSKGFFDLILIDSSDFRGPAAGLFSESFFANCSRILHPHGIVVTQSGSPSLHFQLMKHAIGSLRTGFKNVGCYLTCVPSYLCGFFTFSWGSNGTDLKTVDPEQIRSSYRQNGIRGSVYNPEIHRASFALPNWYRSLIE